MKTLSTAIEGDEVLYSDSMAVTLPYLSTILDAARKSGCSEREISRKATGQPAALSLIKTGRVPSVERVRLLCAALDLEFYIGPPRGQTVSALQRGALPPGENRTLPTDDQPPPWAETLRTGLREDLMALLRESPRRETDDRSVEESASPHETPATRHVEIRELTGAAGGGAETAKEGGTSPVAFRRDWLDRHGIDPTQCLVIDVRGESMEPTVPDGSSILIDCTRRRLRNGGTFAVRTEDGLALKRAGEDAGGRWLVVSAHPGCPAMPWPHDAEIIGEVRWIATLLV